MKRHRCKNCESLRARVRELTKLTRVRLLSKWERAELRELRRRIAAVTRTAARKGSA